MRNSINFLRYYSSSLFCLPIQIRKFNIYEREISKQILNVDKLDYYLSFKLKHLCDISVDDTIVEAELKKKTKTFRMNS